MLGSIPKKFLRSVLSPTDERHVLKFRKDSFTDFDGLDYPLKTSLKIGSFWAPNFCRVQCPKLFYGTLLLWFIPYRVAKFGRVLLSELPVRRPL